MSCASERGKIEKITLHSLFMCTSLDMFLFAGVILVAVSESIASDGGGGGYKRGTEWFDSSDRKKHNHRAM